MQLGLFLCTDVSFVFYKYQSIDKNNKGLLVGNPIAPKPNGEYIGLSLTLIGCIKTFVDARLEL